MTAVTLSDRITVQEAGGRLVAIIGGQAFDPGDQVGGGGHAGPLVQAEAIGARLQGRISTEELEWCSAFWK